MDSEEKQIEQQLAHISGVNFEQSSTKKQTACHVLFRVQKQKYLKHRYSFIEDLFQSYSNAVYQMIEWVLMPKRIAARKNIKTKFQCLIYLSKDFIKENWCLYEIMYIYIKKQKFRLSAFFDFLKPQNFDYETVYTALGYFTEIMIPFAKYEFSSSHTIQAVLQIEDLSQFGGILQIINEEVLTELIGYIHYKPVYDFFMTAYLVSVQDKVNNQPATLLIDSVLQYCQSPSILSKFQENSNLNYLTYQRLFQEFCVLQNVAKTIRELLDNFEPNKKLTIRIRSILRSLLRSKLIYYIVNQLLTCSYIALPSCQEQQNSDTELSPSPKKISIVNKKSFEFSSVASQKTNLFISSPIPKTNLKNEIKSNFPNYLDFGTIQEEDIIEIMLLILTKFFKIYDTFLSAVYTTDDQEVIEIGEQFQQQIYHLLQNMKYLNKLVYKSAKRTKKWITFSSGQEIKPITPMRFQYFHLLYQVLVVTAHCNEEEGDKSGEFTSGIQKKSKVKGFDIEGLCIIQIIQKYLKQNRWNNIAHQLLEKVFRMVILSRPEYFIKNIEKDEINKLSESFLAYLFQNFLQKDYIYLDTFRFTSQGNLHSMYNISKILAYSLNQNNKLLQLLNEYDLWRKFIVFDLKKYEEKEYPLHTEPSKELRDSLSDKYEQIKIDEADSISKLIDDISIEKKWPEKIQQMKKPTEQKSLQVFNV